MRFFHSFYKISRLYSDATGHAVHQSLRICVRARDYTDLEIKDADRCIFITQRNLNAEYQSRGKW